ncbi:hypothetical protein [Limnohabitans sp. Rim8]|uniref:hypothetical protein n=1 Tax=Limnohabitans sp. Rim8 TaxID=1100718 RepID=UPI0033068245
MPLQPDAHSLIRRAGGIQLQYGAASQEGLSAVRSAISTLFASLELQDAVMVTPVQTVHSTCFQCHLSDAAAMSWTPGHDTLDILHRWKPLQEAETVAAEQKALDREIMVALLASPTAFHFSDLEALASSIRVRRFMVEAARKTALAFNTAAAERPETFWRYEPERGFVLQHGQSLICALISATQPEATGKHYDFSCYRATEYVILLGIAQEAQISNPPLFNALQQRNEVHAIRSGLFHEVFLVEYGSMDNPLPSHYYVPGDRLWFRNPDERSSDITGYEGSWVIYMGGGLFSNFWQQDKHYTLVKKCVEIFHWRDGVYVDGHGQLQMDEKRVDAFVAQTLNDPVALAHVLDRMTRMRDPQGVYAQGGCIDTTREHPKQVHASSCDLVLPPWP